jgi:hypothetical protein
MTLGASIASGDDYPFAERALIVIGPPVSLEPDTPEVFIVTEDEYVEYVPDIVAPTDDASSLPSSIREERASFAHTFFDFVYWVPFASLFISLRNVQ